MKKQVEEYFLNPKQPDSDVRACEYGAFSKFGRKLFFSSYTKIIKYSYKWSAFFSYEIEFRSRKFPIVVSIPSSSPE